MITTLGQAATLAAPLAALGNAVEIAATTDLSTFSTRVEVIGS